MLPRVEIYALQVNKPKLLLSLQNIPTIFYTIAHLCAMSVVHLSCSLRDRKTYMVKALKWKVGVLCSDPCLGTGLLTVLD